MSDAAITVRQGTVEDYAPASAVIAETFAFHQQAMPEYFRATDAPPPTQAFITELLRDGTGAWFLAEDAGRVVGYVTVRLSPASHEVSFVPETRAIVPFFGVSPAWQRRGVGRRLMAAVEAWATAQGARRVTLSVWEFNTGAQALYETLGYTTFLRSMWKAL